MVKINKYLVQCPVKFPSKTWKTVVSHLTFAIFAANAGSMESIIALLILSSQFSILTLKFDGWATSGHEITLYPITHKMRIKYRLAISFNNMLSTGL